MKLILLVLLVSTVWCIPCNTWTNREFGDNTNSKSCSSSMPAAAFMHGNASLCSIIKCPEYNKMTYTAYLAVSASKLLIAVYGQGYASHNNVVFPDALIKMTLAGTVLPSVSSAVNSFSWNMSGFARGYGVPPPVVTDKTILWTAPFYIDNFYDDLTVLNEHYDDYNKWTINVRRPPYNYISSAVLFGDRVAFVGSPDSNFTAYNTSGHVILADLTTGAVLATSSVNVTFAYRATLSYVQLASGDLLVYIAPGSVQGFDPRTLKLLWTWTLTDPRLSPSMFAIDEQASILYVFGYKNEVSLCGYDLIKHAIVWDSRFVYNWMNGYKELVVVPGVGVAFVAARTFNPYALSDDEIRMYDYKGNMIWHLQSIDFHYHRVLGLSSSRLAILRRGLDGSGHYISIIDARSGNETSRCPGVSVEIFMDVVAVETADDYAVFLYTYKEEEIPFIGSVFCLLK